MNINAQIAAALTDVADGYIERTADPPKKGRRILLAVIASAACLALVVGAILPTRHWGSYTAEDLAALFSDVKDGGTNAYRTVYTPDPDYLYLSPIPENGRLPVYRTSPSAGKGLSRREFSQFADRILPKMEDSLGTSFPEYEIQEEDYGEKNYFADLEGDGYRLYLSQNRLTHVATLVRSLYSDGRVTLGQIPISIDQTQSDGEIIACLADVREELGRIFGRDFPDTRLVREFDGHSKNGATWVTVYFYDESAHPLNAYPDNGSGSFAPYTDCIELVFDNFVNSDGDIVSEDVLSNVQVRYYEYRADGSDRIKTDSTVEMIPLSKAEELLEAGYTFGGHSCPLCMAMQEKVDFSDYDGVGFTYILGSESVYGEDGDVRLRSASGFPFYVFVKKLDIQVSNGNAIYAKTYVPAIEVDGLEEYFKAQEKNHSEYARWEED